MSNRLYIFAVAALTAGALIASAPPAFAAEREVRISQTQLASESGVAAAYDLIVEVAEDVCAENYSGPRLLRYLAERERCVRDLVNKAVEDAASPKLSAVHARATL